VKKGLIILILLLGCILIGLVFLLSKKDDSKGSDNQLKYEIKASNNEKMVVEATAKATSNKEVYEVKIDIKRADGKVLYQKRATMSQANYQENWLKVKVHSIPSSNAKYEYYGIEYASLTSCVGSVYEIIVVENETTTKLVNIGNEREQFLSDSLGYIENYIIAKDSVTFYLTLTGEEELKTGISFLGDEMVIMAKITLNGKDISYSRISMPHKDVQIVVPAC